jgi:mRNA-degrading endonuclease toxin of MazEF toxin-antitoxin module
LLCAGEGGLRKDSIALCHQVRTVDRLRCRKKSGQATQQSISEIAEGITQILDLDRGDVI